MDTPQFTQDDVKILSRDVLYQGMFRLVKLHLQHKLFNGEWGKSFSREILERRMAAAILPYDPDRDRVILIEQFRPGILGHDTSPWLIEIPAGILDTEESYQEVAIREAEEEAGCKVTDVRLLYDFFASPGGSNEYLQLFFAKVDSNNVDGIHGLAHENEDIRVLNVSSQEAFQWLRERKIKNVPALIGLQWLELNIEKIKSGKAFL